MYAYEQALLALGFYPNIWYQAALYLEDRSKQLLERGVSKVILMQCFQIMHRATIFYSELRYSLELFQLSNFNLFLTNVDSQHLSLHVYHSFCVVMNLVLRILITIR